MLEKLKPILSGLAYELIAFAIVSVLVFVRSLRRRVQTSQPLVSNLEVQTITKESDMEKAYDVKDLLNRCKKDGLEIAEAGAGVFYKNLKEWVQESAVLSENKIDDVVAPFVAHLDPIMLPLIDKVDGENG